MGKIAQMAGVMCGARRFKSYVGIGRSEQDLTDRHHVDERTQTSNLFSSRRLQLTERRRLLSVDAVTAGLFVDGIRPTQYK